WLEGHLAPLPVMVPGGAEGTLDCVLALRPDSVVIATGGRPRRPYVPGADLPIAVPVADVLAGKSSVGQRCVILDETGYTVGPKAADAFSLAGRSVEIVTRQYSL